MKGTVKWFNRVKGYGFILAGGSDYFFHHSSFAGERKSLRETLDGKEVEFTPTKGERGFAGADVRLVP